MQVETGKYAILGDNLKVISMDLETTTLITITYYEGKIRVEKGLELIGVFSAVDFLGIKYNNTFSLKINELSVKRIYEENLSIKTIDGGLLLANMIGLEKYIAGVVQSEVFGSSEDIEFFKIQATVSRTYCLANLNRHLAQGVNLCDGIHCQSYKGRCTQANILKGTYETFSDVVVDTSNKLIYTAYHSNSGGMTESAANVWKQEVPYLQSIKDTFSVHARNAQWEKIIPRKTWIDFFVKFYGEKYSQPENQTRIFALLQNERKPFWIIDTDTIPTRDIRQHFGLRSSFFSVFSRGETVVLKGKGYGHGVGLSQEGAIEMVRQGYGAADILKFYYNGAQVVKYTDIIDL
jgi:stage II sporulation protein D